MEACRYDILSLAESVLRYVHPPPAPPFQGGGRPLLSARSRGRARLWGCRSGCTGAICAGLVARAWEVSAPTGYPLRASPGERIARDLAALGFVPGVGPGAIVLVAPGPGQLHLGIWTGDSIIHADAVVRRVVERAAPLPWPILASWMRED